MGRQVTGLEGTITSWGSGASDWHNHLIATGTAPTNVTINVEGPPMDVVSISGPSTLMVTFVGAVPVAIR